jgi:hypothetical protein
MNTNHVNTGLSLKSLILSMILKRQSLAALILSNKTVMAAAFTLKTPNALSIIPGQQPAKTSFAHQRTRLSRK